MTIGKRLKELRNGLSQRAVAQAVGIKQQVWNRYEKDETAPASDSIIKICNYFDRSANWLLGLPERGESSSPIISQSVSGNHNTLTATVGTPGEMVVCKTCPKVAELQGTLASILQAAKSGAAKLPRKR